MSGVRFRTAARARAAAVDARRDRHDETGAPESFESASQLAGAIYRLQGRRSDWSARIRELMAEQQRRREQEVDW